MSTTAIRQRDMSPSVKPLARTLVAYLVTALVCLIFFMSLYHRWGRDWETPITPPVGDYLFSAVAAKGPMTGTWANDNPFVGAPSGLKLYDFPIAEGVHLLFFKLCGLFGMSIALAMNLFYAGGFILISLTSLYLCRALRLPLLPSMSASLLIAFLPHHWMRAEFHLFLSAYYLVPLMVLVVLWVAQGVPLLSGYKPHKSGWIAIVVCFLMGSGGAYYAWFGAFFLVIAALTSVRRSRWKSHLAQAAVLLGAMVISLGLNILPSVLYKLRHGPNLEVAKRYYFETDVYALKISTLLLPIGDHRIPSWGKTKLDFVAGESNAVPSGDATAALGIAGSIGFLLLLGYSLTAWSRENPDELLGPLSVLNLSGILLATVGGFAVLFSYFISPQIRCYHRISVYTSIFCIVALLAAIRWIAAKRVGGMSPNAVHAIAAVLLFAALWDITPAMADSYPAIHRDFENDRNFIRSIERTVPAGSMIFQLPYQAFPEVGPVQQMGDYDHFRGYFYSNTLRWSYGAIRGRTEDAWARNVSSLPIPVLAEMVRARGFQGIYIDRKGYVDSGISIEKQFDALFGTRKLQDGQNRFIFYGVNGGGSAPQTQHRALTVDAHVEACYAKEALNGNSWCPQQGKIMVTNWNSSTARVMLSMEFITGMGVPAQLKIKGPASDVLMISSSPVEFRRMLEIPPGTTVFELESNGKPLVSAEDPRLKVFGVLNLKAVTY